VNWEQLKTILWLRWRLTRNQWTRGGGVGGAIAVLVGIGAFVLGALSLAGGLIGATQGLREAAPLNVMMVWLVVTVAFLFLWTIGLLTELQRSETIDLQRLMHLPVALGQMFIVNYVTSHLALSIILIVPGMIGLAIGLVIARGPIMLLLLPLALGMVFMITAWTYCLRGWLAAMMTNPRRRRTIVMGITLTFVLLGQGPNLYFNVLRRHDRSSARNAATPEEAQRLREERKAAERAMRDWFFTAQNFFPPLWVPSGARALAEGRVLPALLGTLGCLGIGALGLRRAYRSTVRFYHGESGGKAVEQVETVQVSTAEARTAKAGVRFLELRLPAVPEQAAALALATFRSLLRAPEVKMAWASSFIVTVILCSSVFLRSASKIPEVAKPFMPGGAMAFTIFMLVQFLANQFGFDRDGFRALILSPAERRHILLGKNLASLIVGASFGTPLLVIISFWLRLPLLSLVAGLFQLATLLLLAGLVGNVLSILVPYRIQSGSMKPTKMPGLATLVMVLCHLLFPIAMAPVFLPPLLELLWQMAGWPRGVPVNLVCSVALAALTAFGYWWSLEPLGRLLQRRETKILSVVTVEVE
jgi:ABC-2 type transport system permease protein